MRQVLSATWQLLSKADKKKFFFILLLHSVFTVWFTIQQSPLFDESDYYGYTVNWAKGHPERIKPLFDSKTPAMLPALLPLALKPLLSKHFTDDDPFFYLKAGRFFMYVYQALALFIFFCWLYQLFGSKGWVWPLLLFAFDPLVFSYGMIVGSDMPAMCVLLLLCYAAWRYHVSGNRRYWWIMTFAMAFAVVIKASLLYGYGLLFVLCVFSFFAKNEKYKPEMVKYFFYFLLVQLGVINLAFYFQGTGANFGEIIFTSHEFQSIQHSLHRLHLLPIPLPAAFIQGVDQLQFHAELGGCLANSTYGGVWLLGNEKCQGSFWYYYVVLASFKMPLLVLFFAVAAAVRFFFYGRFIYLLKHFFYIWFPFVFFLIILSFFNKFQIGIRHALFIFPFIYLGIAPVINRLKSKKVVLFYVAIILHGISLFYYWPNLIAYTNELIWNKTEVYKKFRDSSLDYGQTDQLLNDFLISNPEYKLPTSKPDTGYFVITTYKLISKYNDPAHQVYWLEQNFKPYTHHNFTLLVFHITNDDLIKARLK